MVEDELSTAREREERIRQLEVIQDKLKLLLAFELDHIR